MNGTLKMVLIGVLGLGSGFAGGYFFAKHRYEKLADKECESLMKKIDELCVNKEKKDEPKKEESKKTSPIIDEKSYEKFGTEKTYTDYSRLYRTINSDKEDETDAKSTQSSSDYVSLISSSEFVQSINNDQETLMYYSDGILADDDYNEINNTKDYVGNLNLYELFENNDSDAIYIRNAYLKKDFEIVFDERSFQDVAGKWRNLNREDYDNS